MTDTIREIAGAEIERVVPLLLLAEPSERVTPQPAAGAGPRRLRDRDRGRCHQLYRIRGLRNAYMTSTSRFTTRKITAKIRIVFWITR